VLVVVLAVSSMPTPVVHVVDMITVWHRDVAATCTVDMVVVHVNRVAGWLAFVVVVTVPSMKVTVVDEVDVIPVRDRDMAAPFAMHVLMSGVDGVGCAGHCLSPPSLEVAGTGRF
jgi:hypothetical protein